MLTTKQANRLRGLIAQHARCEWTMGVTHNERGTPVNKGIPERAYKARKAVFEELRKLTEPSQ